MLAEQLDPTVSYKALDLLQSAGPIAIAIVLLAVILWFLGIKVFVPIFEKIREASVNLAAANASAAATTATAERAAQAAGNAASELRASLDQHERFMKELPSWYRQIREEARRSD